VLVIYDIGDNAERSALAKDLMKLGLIRIQRSAFAGRANPALIKDILRIVPKRINPENDVVHIVTLCENDWKRIRVIGTPYYRKVQIQGVIIA
jgi:CRISPR-associated protein Cas2